MELVLDQERLSLGDKSFDLSDIRAVEYPTSFSVRIVTPDETFDVGFRDRAQQASFREAHLAIVEGGAHSATSEKGAPAIASVGEHPAQLKVCRFCAEDMAWDAAFCPSCGESTSAIPRYIKPQSRPSQGAGTPSPQPLAPTAQTPIKPLQVTAAPTVSPDGKYWWDGTSWRPMKQAGLDHTFAWMLAIVPLVWLTFAWAWLATFPDADNAAAYTAASVASFIATVAFVTGDERRAKKAGVRLSSAAGVFLLPLYLVQRTKRAGSTPLIPFVWLLAVLVAIGASVSLIPQRVSVNMPFVETQIARDASTQLGGKVSVDCPELVTVNVGEELSCTATVGAFSRLLTLKFDAEGGYSWHT
ncbi:MAG TPA: hypothetical protein VFK41_08990 [Nocardioidaceae bacterium]|nr:hypothetical protein [Nocardioidaceae bacterium]